MLLLIALLSGCAPPPRPVPEGPSVLLVVVDSLRADHLSSYGYARPTSPHLDALAAQGVRYERAVSQAPWTTPSIASMLTSRYPSELGIRDVRATLAPDFLTLAEALHQRGYATGAVVSHSFCSSEWGFDQGFDDFDETWIQGHGAITSQGITDTALEWIAEQGARPWFLFLHYFDPHHAYQLHPEAPWIGEVPYDGPIHPGMPMREMEPLLAQLGPDDLAAMQRYYDSEIRYTDHHLGRLLDALEASGQAEDTLILLTADHGEEFGDHGALGHTKTLYRELVRVPLVVRYPAGGPAAQVSDAPVELVDLYPTVLALTHTPVPEGVVGRSLLDPAGPERPLFSETSRFADLRSLRVGERVLIRDLGTDATLAFDRSTDPKEQHPLAEVPPGLAELLAARIRAPSSAPHKVLTEAERSYLEELGYVDD